MRMSAVIREWRPTDTEAIYRIVEETLPEYGFTPDAETSERDLINIEESYLGQGGAFYVLDLEGSVIGTVGFFGVDAVTCKLRKMYVRRNYRGEGFGKLLLEVAIEKARERGYLYMILETSGRMREAVGLYLATGFREVPIAPTSPRCDTTYRIDLESD